jgi:hypothetical protein
MLRPGLLHPEKFYKPDNAAEVAHFHRGKGASKAHLYFFSPNTVGFFLQNSQEFSSTQDYSPSPAS